MLARAAELTQQSLLLVLILSLPALAAGAVVGVVVGLFAAATQINDATLTFLPRLVAVTLVIVLLGAWGAGTLVRFTSELWRAIPLLVR
jgi:flagellar biosynthetic protein FliQ